MPDDASETAPVLQIEHVQKLTVNGRRVTEGVEVAVRIFYEAISSGWLRERLPNAKSRGTDFMTLVTVALHARPLAGEDLKHLVGLGVATPEDEGRLYARVTDMALADEMGIHRETVRISAERLAECGLLDIYDLPPDYRDSKGQFAGAKAYVLAGELDVLCKEVNRDGLSATAGHRDGFSVTEENDRAGLSVTVEGGQEGSTVTDNPTHHDGLSATNSLLACYTTTTVPARQPSGQPARALTTRYGRQPEDLNPDRAFNLALDKAIAHLPSRLRKGADAPLYTLASMLHEAAAVHPSAAWPDAGGAGWVLDAVLDALGTGNAIGSLNLIRTIAERWLQEGNPYAAWPEAVDNPGDDGLSSSDRAILSAWYDATGGEELDRDDLERLKAILSPNVPPPDEIQATIYETARWIPRPTVDVVAGVLAGTIVVRPPASATERPPPPRGPQRADSANPGAPPNPDPLLGHVVRRYEAEIGTVTQGVAQELLDLTGEYRDEGLWDEAFRAVISSNIRRLDYLRTCLANKAREREDGDGSKSTKPARKQAAAHRPARRGAAKRGRRSGGQRSGRVGHWTDDEIQEAQRRAAVELGEIGPEEAGGSG